eukprot:9347405-Karenia_brevis.AAC.1
METEARMTPVLLQNGSTLRCTTCHYDISAAEHSSDMHISCSCGGFLCYECQEKGRPCRCRGAGG